MEKKKKKKKKKKRVRKAFLNISETLSEVPLIFILSSRSTIAHGENSGCDGHVGGWLLDLKKKKINNFFDKNLARLGSQKKKKFLRTPFV